jgi:hypothetical protein
VESNETQAVPKAASFYRTACGKQVYLSGKAYEHMVVHPEVFDLLPEAISKANLRNMRFAEIEVDLGRAIGVATRTAAPCASDDKVLFAVRDGRDHPSRVIRLDASKRSPTNYVAIVASLDRNQPNTYKLITAWVGRLARREPWDRNIRDDGERSECLKFWCSNALIYDPNVMGEPFESSWTEVLRKALG